jgi:hypothetical protein
MDEIFFFFFQKDCSKNKGGGFGKWWWVSKVEKRKEISFKKILLNKIEKIREWGVKAEVKMSTNGISLLIIVFLAGNKIGCVCVWCTCQSGFGFHFTLVKVFLQSEAFVVEMGGSIELVQRYWRKLKLIFVFSPDD